MLSGDVRQWIAERRHADYPTTGDAIEDNSDERFLGFANWVTSDQNGNLQTDNSLLPHVFFWKGRRILSCLVFAYGSNMCRERILDRVDSAVSLEIGYMLRHQLKFHKRSVDGSAKANAHYTGNVHDATWGVVFRVAVKHKLMLDEFESVGVGYDSVKVEITLSSGKSVRAWTYLARTTAIEDGILPFAWYKNFVVHGARQHGLPADYVRYVKTFQSVPDPDTERSRMNAHLIV